MLGVDAETGPGPPAEQPYEQRAAEAHHGGLTQPIVVPAHPVADRHGHALVGVVAELGGDRVDDLLAHSQAHVGEVELTHAGPPGAPRARTTRGSRAARLRWSRGSRRSGARRRPPRAGRPSPRSRRDLPGALARARRWTTGRARAC